MKKNEEALIKKAFQMPKSLKIPGRITTITNVFVSNIIPSINPKSFEIKKVLAILEQNYNDVRCAYCGDKATEWDHFRPLVKDGRPTGYISEIRNLVPACGKCNQSKINNDWYKWMTGNAPKSPQKRGVKNLKTFIERLKKYEKWSKVKKIDIDKIVGRQALNRYWNNISKIKRIMRESQEMSEKIKAKIIAKIN